jgi:excisionase family DNA binding protein
MNESETNASTRAETLSITEAAQRLGVSVRTVQRRLDAGTLEAAFEGDTRRVILRDTTRHAGATEGDTQRDVSRDNDATQRDSDATSATNESERTRHGDATGRQADATQRDTEGDTSRQSDSEAARVLAQTEAAFLREALEVSRANEAFLRAQVEAANRQAAESAAALREYLKISAKQLGGGDLQQVTTESREYSQGESGNVATRGAQDAQQQPKSEPTSNTSDAQKDTPERKPAREFARTLRRLLGIR